MVGERVTLEWSREAWIREVLLEDVSWTVPENRPRALTMMVVDFVDPTVAVRLDGVARI